LFSFFFQLKIFYCSLIYILFWLSPSFF
jgi:hypothetical protein